MQPVPALLTVHGFLFLNPWRPVNDLITLWSNLGDLTASHFVRDRERSKDVVDLPSVVVVRQLNEVQWRLYERHLVRYHCRPSVIFTVERNRFIRWSGRHSRHFRNLCALYPEWFKCYADLTAEIADETERLAHRAPDLDQLLFEIERHLYQ